MYRKRRAEAGWTVRENMAVPEGHKRCPDCDTIKPFGEFPRNKRGANGIATYCKPCHNERTQDARKRLYGGGREYHLRRRYGIGQVEVDAMLAAQEGVCAVCDKPDPEHVDHDHVTGAIRGMLCFNCNQALGNVRDDLRVLDRLSEYLLAARPGATQLPYVEYRLRGLVLDLASDYRHGVGAR